MKKTEELFKKLSARYKTRKSYYEKKITRWKERGSDRWYKRGAGLLQKADDYMHTIESDLKTKYDKTAIRNEIRKFKKTLQALRELTKPSWRQWTEAILIAAALAFVLRTYFFGLYHVPTGSAEKNILVGDRIWGNKFAYLFSKVKQGDLVIFDRPGFRYDRSNPFKYFWQKYIAFPIPFMGLSDVPQNWVKRVIACPGDSVEGRVEDGKTVIYVNNKKLDEPYVNPYPLIRVKKATGFFDRNSIGPLSIPDFLRKKTRVRIYTYDPSKSLEEQCFYSMKDDELVRDLETGQFLLEHPYTPTYDFYGVNRDIFGPFKVPDGKYWVMGDSRKNSEDSRWWLFLDEKLIHGRASFVICSIDSEEPFWLLELIKHPIDFWAKYMRWNRIGKGLG
jgi:signal peptidase I